MNMITDGTSNTLLVGEKWMYTGWYNVRTSGPGSCIDNEGWPNGWDNDTIGFSGTISYQNTNFYSGNQYVVVPMPDGMLQTRPDQSGLHSFRAIGSNRHHRRARRPDAARRAEGAPGGSSHPVRQ